MDPVIISVLLAFATLYCIVLLVSRLFKRRVKYIDTGKSSVFVSKRYKIAAKPDLIQDNKTLVEKKSRRTGVYDSCLLYTSPSPRDKRQSRMPSSA